MYWNEFDALSIEQEDECARCLYNGQDGIICPYIEGLLVGITDLTASKVRVRGCAFYKQRERHLRLVKPDEGESDDKHDDPTII